MHRVSLLHSREAAQRHCAPTQSRPDGGVPVCFANGESLLGEEQACEWLAERINRAFEIRQIGVNVRFYPVEGQKQFVLLPQSFEAALRLAKRDPQVVSMLEANGAVQTTIGVSPEQDAWTLRGRPVYFYEYWS